MNERSVEVQNVYAIRVIRMVLMGIANGKNSYIDRFIYSLYGMDKNDWDGKDVSWTEHFCAQLNEIVDSIKNGAYWKTGVFFTLIAVEDAFFWECLGIKMQTWKTIQLSTNS